VTTIKTTNDDPTTLKADALVIGVAQGQVAQGQVAQGQEGPLLAGGSEAVDAALGGRLAAVLASLGATGKAEEVTQVPTAGATTAPVVVAVGLGRPGPDGTHAAESLRRASGAVARALAGTKRVATTLVAANAGAAAGPDDLRAVAEGWLLGSYRFTDYLSTTRAAAKEPVATVVLLGLDAAAAKAAKPVLAGPPSSPTPSRWCATWSTPLPPTCRPPCSPTARRRWPPSTASRSRCSTTRR